MVSSAAPRFFLHLDTFAGPPGPLNLLALQLRQHNRTSKKGRKLLEEAFNRRERSVITARFYRLSVTFQARILQRSGKPLASKVGKWGGRRLGGPAHPPPLVPSCASPSLPVKGEGLKATRLMALGFPVRGWGCSPRPPWERDAAKQPGEGATR